MNIKTKKKNKIIVFYSPQGGVGKSTLAINTSIFSALSGIKTLLIDMSIYGNAISTLKIQQNGMRGLSSIITLLDLNRDLESIPNFSEEIKRTIYTELSIENLDVIVSANPIKMESMNAKYTKIIINEIENLGYENIIIDMSSELSEKNVRLLEMADYIIMPVIQDISCGWKMVLFKEIAEKFMIDRKKIKMIINKCNKYSGFNNSEFEAEIGYEVIGEIPLFVKNYQNYINKGILVTLMKNKKVYRNYSMIARKILQLNI